MLNRNNLLRALCLLALCVLLVACAGPLDRKLVTGQGSDAYFASLNPAFAQMSEHEQKAFNWAVSDIDQDQLHARYPQATPRQIIRGEVAAVLEKYPARIAELAPRAAAAEAMRARLMRITVPEVRLKLEKDFFGLMPVVHMVIDNGSDLSLSKMDWDLQLHVDGGETPVASYWATTNFEQEGGLKPGQRISKRVRIGGVSGDGAWTTLEVRNASERMVQVYHRFEGARDFGNRQVLGEDPKAEIERLTAVIAAANSYKDI